MLPALTARQKAIYDFLLKTIREKGFAPSIHEIGRQFKIASTNGVSDHLKALEKKGLYPPGRQARHRSRQCSWAKRYLTATREVPIFGRVRRRQTVSQRGKHRRVLSDSRATWAAGKQFALQVKGDSMIGAGIMDGDRVIVKQQGTAENGEIVCALIDGEATFKRFYQKRRRGHAQSGK